MTQRFPLITPDLVIDPGQNATLSAGAVQSIGDASGSGLGFAMSLPFGDPITIVVLAPALQMNGSNGLTLTSTANPSRRAAVRRADARTLVIAYLPQSGDWGRSALVGKCDGSGTVSGEYFYFLDQTGGYLYTDGDDLGLSVQRPADSVRHGGEIRWLFRAGFLGVRSSQQSLGATVRVASSSGVTLATASDPLDRENPNVGHASLAGLMGHVLHYPTAISSENLYSLMTALYSHYSSIPIASSGSVLGVL